MLVNRKSNGGAASMLQVSLTQQEMLMQDPVLAVSIRDRLMAMGELTDSKFTLICDGTHGATRHVAIRTFSQDPQKLKDAVDAALEELRDCFQPLPRSLAKMLIS